MKGLELAEQFYIKEGKPLLESEFQAVLPYLAAGMFGAGSENLGFDDEISRDHDFEPGFCLFLPSEDVVDRKTAFLLERAYNKLPKEFQGFQRSLLNPAGGHRHGIFRTREFFRNLLGMENGVLPMEGWLQIPTEYLLEATNGKIFEDHLGEVTAIRTYLKNMPADAKYKRLAGHIFMMYEAGEYNYPRILAHGEELAAHESLQKFVYHAMNILFLLKNEYMPYYKWSYRALRETLQMPEAEMSFRELLMTENKNDQIEKKLQIIKDTEKLVLELSGEDITKNFEELSYAFNQKIQDPEIRNLNLLYCV